VLKDVDSLKNAAAYIRSKEDQWSVDPKQIGVMGTSAAVDDFKAATANFAVLLNAAEKIQGDDNLISVKKVGAGFTPDAAWTKDIIKFIEPRKTKVF